MTIEETWELAGRLFTSKGLEEENISKFLTGKQKKKYLKCLHIKLRI